MYIKMHWKAPVDAYVVYYDVINSGGGGFWGGDGGEGLLSFINRHVFPWDKIADYMYIKRLWKASVDRYVVNFDVIGSIISLGGGGAAALFSTAALQKNT